MSNGAAPYQQRSTFVSVVAWIFIVLTGFGALIGLMQNIMVHTMFSVPEMKTAMNSPEAVSEIPPFARFMFNHFRLFVFLMFAITLFTLITSIGVLKRKNWARRVFIGLLGLSILLLLGSIAAQFFFFPGSSGFGSEEIPAEMKTMMTFMQVFFAFFYGAIAVILGWIIKKLLSAGIAHEFQRQ